MKSACAGGTAFARRAWESLEGFRVENADVALRYGNRDVDCADAAVKSRVETALERIDMAIADSSFSRALPSVSGVSGADPLKGT